MSQTILVIEDEPAIADTILYALRTEGFQTLHAQTAAEGIQLFHDHAVHLIVLDVGLPDENGFEVCKRIRTRSAVPIIFLTARAGEVDRVVGLELGGDDYMPKPFSPRELAARVKAVLRRSPAPPPAASTGISLPFSVDEQRKKIYYYGQALDLSRYEFRLLEVLLQRPGWVYSRDQLMNMAWDAPDFSTDRTVDTHIKTIRAKLRQIRPGIDPIQTHRGMGYSLKESW